MKIIDLDNNTIYEANAPRVINLDAKVWVKNPSVKGGGYYRSSGSGSPSKSAVNKAKRNLAPKVVGGAVLGTAALMGGAYAIEQALSKKGKREIERAAAERSRHTEEVLAKANREIEAAKKLNEELDDVKRRVQEEASRRRAKQAEADDWGESKIFEHYKNETFRRQLEKQWEDENKQDSYLTDAQIRVNAPHTKKGYYYRQSKGGSNPSKAKKAAGVAAAAGITGLAIAAMVGVDQLERNRNKKKAEQEFLDQGDKVDQNLKKAKDQLTNDQKEVVRNELSSAFQELDAEMQRLQGSSKESDIGRQNLMKEQRKKLEKAYRNFFGEDYAN